VVEFARDSPLEGDGFEPSSFSLESSVSAALAASVAANLHPYIAQFCNPASTEILQNRARGEWRKMPRQWPAERPVTYPGRGAGFRKLTNVKSITPY
jgi:hypothetical protein